MLTLGAEELAVVDVDVDRSRDLAAALVRCFGPRSARAVERSALPRLVAAADGLVHATPVGMAAYPGTAVAPELLRSLDWVAEIVYMPLETQLLRDARAHGCRTLSGAPMVALQAAGSMELFLGVRPDRERMLAHVQELTADARQAA
jgi:shikimate dehydrogenase